VMRLSNVTSRILYLEPTRLTCGSGLLVIGSVREVGDSMKLWKKEEEDGSRGDDDGDDEAPGDGAD
jgi:hypothetical protein